MKSLQHITRGIDEGGNTYKHIRTQNFTSGKTKVTNTYFFNGEKVTKHMRWTVENWFYNNFNTQLETIQK